MVLRYSNIVLIFCLALLLTSCEDQIKQDLVTAKVIEEAKFVDGGCEYPDGGLCVQECCYMDQSCNGPSFKKCDLASGKWSSFVYTNSDCNKECLNESKEKETKIEKELITEEDKQKTKEMLKEFMEVEEKLICAEGWVCVNSSFRGYQSKGCEILKALECKAGCLDSKCNHICNAREKRCNGKKLQICDEGVDWDTEEVCKNGCEDEKCIGEEEPQIQEGMSENQSQILIPIIMECEKDCIQFVANESNVNLSIDCNGSTGEFVIFENLCIEICSVTGWELSDLAGTKFIFPEFNTSSRIKIITSKGINTKTELFWNRCSSVWNNNGDTLYLKNTKKEEVVQYTYQ